MKVLRISLLLLIGFSLISGICYGQTIEEHYEKGIECSVTGRFEEAQQEFKKALEIDPFYIAAENCLRVAEDVLGQRIKTETAIYLFNGVAYLNGGMLNEAIALYEKAIKSNPEYAGAHYNLGAVYFSKGMLDKAIFELKKAIEINPEYVDAYTSLGVVYINKGMVEEADVLWRKAIEINPNYAGAYYNLGAVYFSRGMLDEAIFELKKAIEINPNYADAHNNLAIVYYCKEEYELAIKHCDIVIELGFTVHPKVLELLEPYR